MYAKTIPIKAALPAVVASISFFFIFSSAQDTAAFQVMQGASQGSVETCTFTLQMDDTSFRQRYKQKVARLLNREVSPNMVSVEEMYGNIRKVSLLAEEDGAEAMSNGSGVDPLSGECLGCHDGSGASNKTINLKNDPYRHSGREFGSFGASDHPIGMDYDRYLARGINYKPQPGKRRMILVNGKVGCLTCHNPLNKEKGHLVMNNDRSALCLACHRM